MKHLLLFYTVCTLLQAIGAAAGSGSGTQQRRRDHIEEALLSDTQADDARTVAALEHIYQHNIRPAEQRFQYHTLKNRLLSKAPLSAKPVLLFTGASSTGKTTAINHVLGDRVAPIDSTHSRFTILTQKRESDADDSTERSSSVEDDDETVTVEAEGNAVLDRFTIVDSKPIDKQTESEWSTLRWLLQQTDLTVVVFDATQTTKKLTAEMNRLMGELDKTKRQYRIVLNKADAVTERELMGAYGQLMWSLSQSLPGHAEAPRVYLASLTASKNARTAEAINEQVLYDDEAELFDGLATLRREQLGTRVAQVLSHAKRVRLHAHVVDSYVAEYRSRCRLNAQQNQQVINTVHKKVASSNEDDDLVAWINELMTQPEYRALFDIDQLQSNIEETEECLTSCSTSRLDEAIEEELPQLMAKIGVKESKTKEKKRSENAKPAPKKEVKKEAPAAAVPPVASKKEVMKEAPAAAVPKKSTETKPKSAEPKKPASEPKSVEKPAVKEKTKEKTAEKKEKTEEKKESEEKQPEQAEVKSAAKESPKKESPKQQQKPESKKEQTAPKPKDDQKVQTKVSEQKSEKRAKEPEVKSEKLSKKQEMKVERQKREVKQPVPKAPEKEDKEEDDDSDEEDSKQTDSEEQKKSTSNEAEKTRGFEKAGSTESSEEHVEEDEEVIGKLIAETFSYIYDEVAETVAENVGDLEMSEQQKCKWRESCYETGELPEIEAVAGLSLMDIDWKDPLGFLPEIPTFAEIEISDKQKCKFRESCYETGVLPETEAGSFDNLLSVFSLSALTSFEFPALPEGSEIEISDKQKCKFRQSCYDTGEVPEIDSSFSFELPSLTAFLSFDFDFEFESSDIEMSPKQRCKFRESCYETGVVPEIEPGWNKIWAESTSGESSNSDESDELDEDASEKERKYWCKFRESCYETGERPPNKVQLFQSAVDSDDDDDDSDESDELDEDASEKERKYWCKFRESCYETGERPPNKVQLFQSAVDSDDDDDDSDESDELDEDASEKERKYWCKFRESCYETGERPPNKVQFFQSVVDSDEDDDDDSDESDEQDEDASEKERKYWCKFRESCYETGERPPNQVQLFQSAVDADDDDDDSDESDELDEDASEKERKYWCKFRESCYETGERPPNQVQLFQSAVDADDDDDDSDESNELDEDASEKERKYWCKFRESCYETGERPPNKVQLFQSAVDADDDDDDSDEDDELDEDASEKERKYWCKFRESCYESGVRPKNKVQLFQGSHDEGSDEDDDDDSSEPPEDDAYGLKMWCKYRESCYESGVRPKSAVHLLQRTHEESEDDDNDGELSAYEKKYRCKFRISCYESGDVPDLSGDDDDADEDSEESKETPPPKKIKFKKKSKAESEPEEDDDDDEDDDEASVEEEDAGAETEAYEYDTEVDFREPVPAAKEAESDEDGRPKERISEAQEVEPEKKELFREETTKTAPSKKDSKWKKPAEPKRLVPKEQLSEEASTSEQTVAASQADETDTSADSGAPETEQDETTEEVRENNEDVGDTEDTSKIEESSETESEHVKVDYAQKMECHYRKSCYATGEVPDLSVNFFVPTTTAGSKDTEVDIEDLSQYEQKLWCRYRQSCYETGERPTIDSLVYTSPKTESSKQFEDDEDLSEAQARYQRKLFCQYRESCYETGERVEINSGIFAGSVSKGERQETSSEEMTESESIYANKLRCKFRESCYETGELPEIGSGIFTGPSSTGKSASKDEEFDAEEASAYEKKLWCHYRFSCYETGEKPDLDTRPVSYAQPHEEREKKVSVSDEHKQVQAACHYRKSCYETGQVPQFAGMFASPVAYGGGVSDSEEVDLDDTRALRLHCQYRKSCYESGQRVPINAGLFSGPSATGADDDDDDEVHSEYEMKLRCRYRHSCYNPDAIVAPKQPKPAAAVKSSGDGVSDRAVHSRGNGTCPPYRISCRRAQGLPEPDPKQKDVIWIDGVKLCRKKPPTIAAGGGKKKEQPKKKLPPPALKASAPARTGQQQQQRKQS